MTNYLCLEIQWKFKATFLILFISSFFRIQHLNTGWIMIKFHQKSTRSSRTGPDFLEIIQIWCIMTFVEGILKDFLPKNSPKFQVYNLLYPKFTMLTVGKCQKIHQHHRRLTTSFALSVDPQFCNWSCGHGLENSPIREKNRPTLLRHMVTFHVLPPSYESCWKLLSLKSVWTALQLIRL